MPNKRQIMAQLSAAILSSTTTMHIIMNTGIDINEPSKTKEIIFAHFSDWLILFGFMLSFVILSLNISFK